MRIYDISVPIAPGETPTYPGDPGIEVGSWSAIARGDRANVSVLNFGAHTGTHIDAPAHFIEGAPGMTSLPLDALWGRARVVEIPSDADAVGESHVRPESLQGATRVLFKTRNSAFWEDPRGQFRKDFAYIEPEAARALVAAGVRLVGFDYLSVEKFGSEGFETHLALLSAGVVIVEGLDLRAVGSGLYELCCLPLRVAAGSGDGAPARAVLRTLDRADSTEGER
ncbi:MAG TPA: cyclase family protein [Pyrinomonadaceae bacterium]